MANTLLQFDDDLIGDTPISTLDDVEEDFCQHYVANGVAWVAYRDTIAAYKQLAGNTNTLRKASSMFMQHERIKKRIAELRSQSYAANEITPARVVEELGKMAFFDIRKVFDRNGNLKAVHELDDVTAAGIAGLEVSQDSITKSQNIYGAEDEADIGRVDETKVVTRTAKLKLVDKSKALDQLSRIMGLQIERIQHTGADGAPLIPQDSDIATARKVAFLLSQGVVQQGAAQ